MHDVYAVSRFIRAVQAAFESSALVERSAAVVSSVFSDLQSSRIQSSARPEMLPACVYLSSALVTASRQLMLWELVESFQAIAGNLEWYRSRMQSNPKTASANFMDGHANAAIFGPGGLVHSDQLRLGVSLLAPHVRHPDHSHSPDEVYLMISEGQFRQSGGDWFRPGFGGVLYNESNIVHAMRSGPGPLLAFWALGS